MDIGETRTRMLSLSAHCASSGASRNDVPRPSTGTLPMWIQLSAVVPVRNLIQRFDTRAFTVAVRPPAPASTPANTEAEVAAALARVMRR